MASVDSARLRTSSENDTAFFRLGGPVGVTRWRGLTKTLLGLSRSGDDVVGKRIRVGDDDEGTVRSEVRSTSGGGSMDKKLTIVIGRSTLTSEVKDPELAATRRV